MESLRKRGGVVTFCWPVDLFVVGLGVVLSGRIGENVRFLTTVCCWLELGLWSVEDCGSATVLMSVSDSDLVCYVVGRLF